MAVGELDRFAAGLVRLVRDRSIEACDRLVAGAMVGPDGDRWRSFVVSDETRQALDALVPDVVDQALFELLNAIDSGQFPLAWKTLDGSMVTLEELGSGEMAGWLMGSPGWRNEYSGQRFFDPLSDLRLDRSDDDEEL